MQLPLLLPVLFQPVPPPRTEFLTLRATQYHSLTRYPGSRGCPLITSPCRRRSLPAVCQTLT